LAVAHREDKEFSTTAGTFFKFQQPLVEMDFGVHGGRDYHMDLGKFFRFLQEHQCENVFSILFGVQGTPAADG